MTTTTKPLTRAQQKALGALKVGGFPLSEGGGLRTGINLHVLKSLRRRRLISYDQIFLGGIVYGLKVG